MKRSVWLPVILLAVACGDAGKAMTDPPVVDDTGDEDSVSDGGDEEGGPKLTTGVMEPDGDDTTGGESSGGVADTGGCQGFLCPVDMDSGGDCDQWAQDCMDGLKCSAYADNGGTSWNNTKCVPVAMDADQPGDKCTVEGNGVSGLDSCDKGVMCWDVDPNTNEGVCVALCEGSEMAPQCDSGFSCAIANTVLNLCLPVCDPLIQDCPGDDLCIPSGESFLCVLDASGEEGQVFDPCEFANACDRGLYCMEPGYASECDPNASGCCLPFCELTAPDCPGVGQQCLPWFEEGTAPPAYETVGICGLPQ